MAGKYVIAVDEHGDHDSPWVDQHMNLTSSILSTKP